MAKWRRRDQSGQGPDRRPEKHQEKPPAELDFERFLKLCAMLASPSDSERASAALKASEMLKAANLTWNDVIKDRGSLVEEVYSDDAEGRARRFWKTKGPPDQSRSRSDAT